VWGKEGGRGRRKGKEEEEREGGKERGEGGEYVVVIDKAKVTATPNTSIYLITKSVSTPM